MPGGREHFVTTEISVIFVIFDTYSPKEGSLKNLSKQCLWRVAIITLNYWSPEGKFPEKTHRVGSIDLSVLFKLLILISNLPHPLQPNRNTPFSWLVVWWGGGLIFDAKKAILALVDWKWTQKSTLLATVKFVFWQFWGVKKSRFLDYFKVDLELFRKLVDWK